MRILLVIGLGDVAQRAMPAFIRRYGAGRVFALVRNPGEHRIWAKRGVRLLRGDLARRRTLQQLPRRVTDIAHCAPPPSMSSRDLHTRNLLGAIDRSAKHLRRLVYISTSGVYGDCNGHLINETHPIQPQTARAVRRADAEHVLLRWGKLNHVAVCVLRAPGIYAAERLPLERLRSGTPALRAEEDVYTNHIHADDLAAILIAALRHSRGTRVYNASDDTRLRMGDYFDLVADHFGLPRPQRISRADARHRLSPALYSFMAESRLLDNRRMKRELSIRLRYPTVADFLATQKGHD